MTSAPLSKSNQTLILSWEFVPMYTLAGAAHAMWYKEKTKPNALFIVSATTCFLSQPSFDLEFSLRGKYCHFLLRKAQS